MTKKQIIEGLREYFSKKGKFLTISEYVDQPDTPFRLVMIKRSVGNWRRLQKIIGPIEPKAPKPEPKK